MREQYIKDIREACIKANPEIDFYSICSAHQNQGFECDRCKIGTYRPIRLADVLYAYCTKVDYHMGEKTTLEIIFGWNLRNDDLNELRDKYLKFLADLLN